MAVATWTTAGVVAADQPPSQTTETMVEKLSLMATVEKIDTKKRELTLKDEQGNEFKVTVPEDVTRLEAIKQGDHIAVDYYKAVALSLNKEGSAGAKKTTLVERKPGKLPGGVVARTITATAEVMKVDTTNHKVTIKEPTGELNTINVTDPAMQAELANLKKGDRIQATYTEAVAVSVTRHEKKKM